MEPQATSTAGSLDPQAVALAKAIRQTESGSNPNARGKSGEYGAYQYTAPTWQKMSKEAGVNTPLEGSTLEQQNQVAYHHIKKWKDNGYNPGQIASMWNAGEGEPDAYTGKFSNGQPSVGVNKFGAHFDVPAYTKSVATAYQTLKQGGQVSPDPNNPSSTANKTPIEPPKDPNAPDTYGATFPSSPDDNPLVAGAKALGNVPSSFANLGGGLVQAAMHPIKTVEGLGSAAIGGVENLTGANQGNPDEHQKIANAIGKSLVDRYGSIENMQRTATNDPAGFGADVLTLLEGGTATLDKIAGTTSRAALNKGLETVAHPIAEGIKAVAQSPFKLAAQTMGLQTGVGADPIKQGFTASVQGGDANKAFLEGLRNGGNPEEIVGKAREALGEVVQNRSKVYKQMLSALGKDKTTYDISPIYKEVDNQLVNKLGVEITENGLDFSRSKFALDSAAQADITKLYDYVKGYGLKAGDRTALGIDNLKQVLGGYWSPNSDYRSLVEALRKSTRTVLNDAPGYTDAMKSYSDISDTIKDITQSLSLGEKASVETSFKKLISSLKNNDFRKQVIQELDQTTNAGLLPRIAGHQLSSAFPRGLMGIAEGGIASATGVIHGAGGILPLLALAITTSPRVVGEFIHALGVGSRGSAAIMKLLNRIPKPVVMGGNLLNRAIEQNQ